MPRALYRERNDNHAVRGGIPPENGNSLPLRRAQLTETRSAVRQLRC
ncbi:MAG: hypothetical protein H7Y02_01200 [Candidatus Obscuribacterales bacterium]|nr:hypothetical protein [Steroidobacteraceae bacterium]